MHKPQTVAVDVDGTLLKKNGEANLATVDWLRAAKAQGYTLFLWSARGEAHARRAAELCGVTELFCAILAKPGYILDDVGWTWIRFTRVIHSLDQSLPPMA